MLYGRPRKPFDRGNALAIVAYEDGSTAYLLMPKDASPGLDLVVAQERQARGEIPEGAIVSVRRAK